MATEFQILWLPKRGNTVDEYEDRATGNAELGRFAIADGATESSYASVWAEMLVTGFVESELRRPADQSVWLSERQGCWLSRVTGQPLSWYAEAKLAEGAFATLLGLVVQPRAWPGRTRWFAIAVGDSCLFQVRNGYLRKSFPMNDPEDFGNTPALIGSRMLPDRIMDRSRWHVRKGHWLPEDRFWLMTDALAQWFLRLHQAGEKPWERLEQFTDNSAQESFATWIDALRDRREIRNDDVTLLAVRV